MRNYIRIYCNGEKIRSVGVGNWQYNYHIKNTQLNKSHLKLKFTLRDLLYNTYFYISKPTAIVNSECRYVSITYDREFLFDIEFVKCNRSGTKRIVEKRVELPYCLVKRDNLYALANRGYKPGDGWWVECQVEEVTNFKIKW